MDANGCSTWSNTTPCGDGEFCSNGACGTCANNCTPGARHCGPTGGVEECRPQGNGCNDWVLIANCQAGDSCSNGACIPPCQDACMAGAGQCLNGVPSLCVQSPSGCTTWQTQAACASGNTCVDGICQENCGASEVDTCPNGTVCTALPDARVCLPSDPSMMSTQPTTPTTPTTGSNPAATTSHHQTTSVGDGADVIGTCGCSAAGAPLGFLGLLLLRSARRTRTPGNRRPSARHR
jgi:hypothetical protein